MKNSIQLANRFREVILDGTWIAGTNLQDQVRSLTLEPALARVADLNTVAELTFHLGYYISGILNVFEGDDLEIRDKYSFDLPEMNSEQDWQKLKTRIFSDAERFAVHVEEMPESRLAEAFIDEKYGSFQRNIEAVIEHSYYHLGQISLIKKLLKNEGKL